MTTAAAALKDEPGHLNYRAYMTCSASDAWLPQAEAQLSTWLREKQLDIDATRDGVLVDGSRRLALAHHEAHDSKSLRAILVEAGTPYGTWTTELLASDRRGDGDWLTINVTNDSNRFVDVPRIARYLIKALPLIDGSIEFIDEPRVINEHRIDELIDLLCDQERHGLVFAAGTTADNGADVSAFVKQVEEWTRQVYGLAQVVVLDPVATALLQDEFGRDHAAPPWAIRTYFPGVDPASRVDARRHRILGSARLSQESEGRVRLMLGHIARAEASRRLLPQDAVGTRRAFDRLDNHAILDAIESPVTAGAPESSAFPTRQVDLSRAQAERSQILGAESVETYIEQIAVVRSVLGISTVDAQSLQRIVDLALAPRTDMDAVQRAARQIDALQTRAEQLEDALRAAEELLDEGQIERAETYDALQSSLSEARWLRGRLVEKGDFQSAYDAPPERDAENYPESFAELLQLLERDYFETLVFTGEHDTTLQVDAQDSLQLAVRNCWDVCRTLSDYIRARRDGACANGVDHYLKHTPHGYRSSPPGKHAYTETKATMKRFGGERVFPVPTDVDPAGRVEMTAHFKLAQIGMISPRLYYLDDFTRTDHIYIGYIGPHLTNTQTN